MVSIASDLVWPMRPTGPRLIQPVAYTPLTRSFESLLQHLALAVRDDAVPLVERHAGQRRAEVADGAVQRLDRHLADLAGADDAALAVGTRALVDERGHAALGILLHLERLGVEVQVQATGRRAPGVVDRVALAPRLQHAVDHHDLLVARDRGARRVVVVEVLVVDDHVDVAQLAEFAQLERRELHLRGPAAAEDVHVGDGFDAARPS